MRPCLAIPIYDHAETIAGVIESLAYLKLPCIIVDDGSHDPTKRELADLEARFDWVQVVRHATNLGKGAALRTAYRIAHEHGMTHVVQLDADGQHDSRDVPLFLDAARRSPDALVLGSPIFDDSVPFHRLHGRKLSYAVVWLETLSMAVRDPLCGFRCIPLAATLDLLSRVETGDRMDFDPELVIRLVRAGVPIVNVPTAVSYHEGGVSHFAIVRDNLRIAQTYLRLAFEALGYHGRGGGSGRHRLETGRPRDESESRPTSGESSEASAEWESESERGSGLALQFVLGCVRTIGPGPLAVLLAPVALYFTLFDATARHASLDYLRRVRRSRGEAGPPGLLDVYRHLYTFSATILDRITLWSGAFDDFEIQSFGREYMQSLVDEGRGAFLVGAHLGSFDVLRVMAREIRIPITVLMYAANSRHIRRMFEDLDPDSNVRIIHVDEAAVKIAFEVKRCIARGEFVAVLGDRPRPGARRRIGYATFLGDLAPFPQGPFLIASLLELPVVLVIALRRGRRRYDIHLETISYGRPVSPKDRPKSIQQQIEHYASRLEHYCLETPLQWFNFYDFWAKVDDERR